MKIQEHVKDILKEIGEDPDREGLRETPARVERAYAEIFSGYNTNPDDLLKTFTEGSCEEMVMLDRCEFFSTCEHHLFPFFGHVSIGYIPNGKVIGVSKLARLVDCYSRRLQIQERLTAQIADAIYHGLDAKGVMVICRGQHFCMTSRGVRKHDAEMVTSAIRGIFKTNDALRNEFLRLANG